MERIVVEIPEEHYDFVWKLALNLRIGSTPRVTQELEDEMHAALDTATLKSAERTKMARDDGTRWAPRNQAAEELALVHRLHDEALQWFLRIEKIIDILIACPEPEAKSTALPKIAMRLAELAERTNAR